MCYKLYNLIRSTRDRNLTQLQKCIMLSLASRAKYIDQKWDNIWPSYGLIAKDVGCSRVSAVNNIKQLVDKGYLTKTKRAKNENLPYGTKRIIKDDEDIHLFESNQYWIVLEKFGIKSSSNSPIEEIVDNSVDKGVDNKGIREYPEQQAVLGDRVYPLPRGGKGDLSYRSYHTTIIKNHDVNEGLKRDVLNDLLKISVKKSDALNWIEDHGIHRMNSLLSLVIERNKDPKNKIYNPGAWIRSIVEGRKRIA